MNTLNDLELMTSTSTDTSLLAGMCPSYGLDAEEVKSSLGDKQREYYFEMLEARKADEERE